MLAATLTALATQKVGFGTRVEPSAEQGTSGSMRCFRMCRPPTGSVKHRSANVPAESHEMTTQVVGSIGTAETDAASYHHCSQSNAQKGRKNKTHPLPPRDIKMEDIQIPSKEGSRDPSPGWATY